MAVLDDYLVAFFAAATVAALVILISMLSRYRALVKDTDKSTTLAKDLWDSVNSKFALLDRRIIELMVRTDLLMSRTGAWSAVERSRVAAVVKERPAASPEVDVAQGVTNRPAAQSVSGTEVEVRILRFLLDGSKSSARIRQELGKSREHTARLMKSLFDRGLVVRNDSTKPYVYELTDSGRTYVN